MSAVGLIDDSLASEVVSLYRSRKPHDLLRWNCQGAIETTVLLMTDKVKIASRLKPHRVRFESEHASAFGALHGGLVKAKLAVRSGVNDHDRGAALAATGAWAAEHPAELRRAYAELDAMPQFAAFAEQHRRYNWGPSRDGLIFDEEFVPALAAATGEPDGALRRLFEATRTAAFMDRVKAPAQDAHPDTELLRRLYFMSAMLRALARERLARELGWQVLHHPYRDPILPALATPAADVTPTAAATYLAMIVVANGFTDAPHEQRIADWVTMVARTRALLRDDSLRRFDAERDDAFAYAVRAAGFLGIAKVPEAFGKLADGVVSLGIAKAGALLIRSFTSFDVEPLLDAAAVLYPFVDVSRRAVTAANAHAARRDVERVGGDAMHWEAQRRIAAQAAGRFERHAAR